MLCDKCGKSVRYENDATVVDSYLTGVALTVFVHKPRHLLPTYNGDGSVDCEGSPSRAQYLEGMPRDTRYAYDTTLEPRYRYAYKQIQAAAERANV